MGLSQEQRNLQLYSNRQVNFNHPDGAYSNKMLQNDFGNGKYPAGRDFATIEKGRNAWQDVDNHVDWVRNLRLDE